MKRLLVIFALLLCLPVWAAEVIPPAPQRYFNDYANVTSPATAERLNRQLEDFEKQTSSQIVVAVYPKMQSDSSIEEYAVRVFRAWGIGQTNKNNGALLLVFVQDHKMNITTGYGLEGALPDVICKQIISYEIAPRFKQGDFDGGLSAGVSAMIAAAKGEYKGTGRTVYQAKQQQAQSRDNGLIILGVIVFVLLISLLGNRRGRRRGWVMSSGGWGGGGWGGGWGGWSGGGGGGGGWSGGGGGGFSGGGGSTGGGGASGSW